jgi:hypothetical protein
LLEDLPDGGGGHRHAPERGVRRGCGGTPSGSSRGRAAAPAAGWSARSATFPGAWAESAQRGERVRHGQVSQSQQHDQPSCRADRQSRESTDSSVRAREPARPAHRLPPRRMRFSARTTSPSSPWPDAPSPSRPTDHCPGSPAADTIRQPGPSDLSRRFIVGWV